MSEQDVPIESHPRGRLRYDKERRMIVGDAPTPSSDVLVRPDLVVIGCEHVHGRMNNGDPCPIEPLLAYALAAAEKIETLEKREAQLLIDFAQARAERDALSAHLAAVRDQRGVREQVLERRVRDLEAAFFRVSDEGDALNADLTRAREEAGEARRLLRNLYIYVASQASNSNVPHPNTILAARQASTFLSVSTSTETWPARDGTACVECGHDETSIFHTQAKYGYRGTHPFAPPAPENTPQEKR